MFLRGLSNFNSAQRKTKVLSKEHEEINPQLQELQGAARTAYEMAGIGPKDIQFAEVHDCFTFAELMAYEDLGFCKPGKGGKLVESNETRLGGSLPVNTSGGLKAKGHPVGATGTAQAYEMYLQLTGQAERHQVKEARIGLTHNVGGSGATAAVHIYRSD